MKKCFDFKINRLFDLLIVDNKILKLIFMLLI